MNCDAENGFRVGDKVFGTSILHPYDPGTLSEYIKVPIDSICTMPSNLSYAQASVLPLVGLTALQVFEDYCVQKHNNVLIIGGSGFTI